MDGPVILILVLLSGVLLLIVRGLAGLAKLIAGAYRRANDARADARRSSA